MYAITTTSYRAITDDMDLNPGEEKVDELPASLLSRIKGEKMKVECSQRLRACDWTQMDDAPLSAVQKTAWANYRKALRELPSLPAFPEVEWPTPPSLDNAASGVGTVGL